MSAIRMTCVFLSLLMAFPPGLMAAASAIDAAKTTPVAAAKAAPAQAPAKHVKAVKMAAGAGLLGGEKEKYASKKSLTDVEVTDALAALYPAVLKIDLKTLKPGDQEEGLLAYEALLDVVVEKKGALRSRGLSAWTLENRLQKIVEALSGTDDGKAGNPGKEKAADEAGKTGPKEAVPAKAVEMAPAGPSDDWKALKGSLDGLSAQFQDLRKTLDERMKDVEKGQSDDRAKVGAVQDDLSLIRDNLDALQGNLKSLGGRVEDMEKKVEDKGLDAEGQKREWTIMRKDIRDHSQDLSVLKQKVEKLMAPEKRSASPIDKALSSKWLPGAAILLAVTAIVISASK